MSRFVRTSPLEIGERAGEWVLVNPVEYWSDLAGRLIVIPAGFVTDLASVPWLFQWAIPVNGRHRNAAVLHDYLYRMCACWCSRKLADQIFREAMQVLGEQAWRREAMYRGVRVGGWLHYRRCRRGQHGVRM